MITVFENIYPFDLEAIAEGGQAFRWKLQNDGSYIGVVGQYVIKALQQGDKLKIESNIEQGFNNVIEEYFDLQRDYKAIENQLSLYEELVPAVKYCSGYRVLRQEPWETTISFIISANNNIRNIKNSIELLCRLYGEPIVFGGKTFYSFPTPDSLARACETDLGDTRCGYRARYIKGAAEMIACKDIDLVKIKDLPALEAKRELIRLPGVGPKVADCILLYSMQRFDAIPVDVWIKRALENLYFKGENTSLKTLQTFAKERFGPMAGFAQQYLFHYFRTIRSTG